MSSGRIIVVVLIVIAVLVLLGFLFGVDLSGSSSGGGTDSGPVGY
jgi:hypothetical protein